MLISSISSLCKGTYSSVGIAFPLKHICCLKWVVYKRNFLEMRLRGLSWIDFLQHFHCIKLKLTSSSCCSDLSIYSLTSISGFKEIGWIKKNILIKVFCCYNCLFFHFPGWFFSIIPEKGTKVERTNTSHLPVNSRVLTLIQELSYHEWLDVWIWTKLSKIYGMQ